MSTAVIDHRLTELERQVSDLNAKLLKLTPPEKNWQQLAGAFQDSPISREADRLGEAWRRQQNDE